MPSSNPDNVITAIGSVPFENSSATGLVEKITSLAAELVRRRSANHAIVEEIKAIAPELEDFLGALLHVGGGSRHPELVLNRCPAYTELKSQAFVDQKSILAVGAVDVVINADTGDFVRVSLVEMSRAEVEQVFNYGSLRSNDEQRDYIVLKSHFFGIADDRGYVIRGRWFWCRRGMTKTDLAGFIEQMSTPPRLIPRAQQRDRRDTAHFISILNAIYKLNHVLADLPTK